MKWSRSTITVRGSSLLAAGVATGVGAVLLGEVDLLRIAVAITLLVLVCWAWMGLSGLRLQTTHRASQHEAAIGTPIEVEISLTTRSALPLSSLECLDLTGDGLGARPTLLVDARAARSGVSMRYTCSPKTRGRHRIGPLALKVTDVFGLITTTKTGTEHIEILGLPVVEELGERWTLRHVGRTGNERRVAETGAGQFDAALRDHEPLDGLRRVHWRSSARQGKLMVRQDAQVRERRATLVLDDRDGVHNPATFDQMMGAAASVGAHLLRQGYQLTTRGSRGEVLPGYGAWLEQGWIRTLALAEPTPVTAMTRITDALYSDHEVGPLFLFLTDSSAPDAALLQRARSLNTAATAIVIEHASQTLAEDVLQELLRNKWRVVVVPAGGTLAGSLDSESAEIAADRS
ncbi:DUF58 domain-containing protein [Antricoccus suffuscus]|nr:DUF58 domain-containing protein [Antricoccus suffuscus]